MDEVTRQALEMLDFFDENSSEEYLENELLRLQILTNELDEYQERLERWQTQRPFLYVSQCTYAQTIVYDMITIAEKIVSIDPEWLEEGTLEYLQELLNTLPPPDDDNHAPLMRGMTFLY